MRGVFAAAVHCRAMMESLPLIRPCGATFPRGEGWGISSTLLYAACPATYYTSIGCSCTPRRAASSVSGSRVKSLFRLRGFL